MVSGLSLLSERHLRTFGDEVDALELLAVAEHDRAEMAANQLRNAGCFGAHRGGDQALHPFVIVNREGGHVGRVAVIVFQEDTAAADNPSGNASPVALRMAVIRCTNRSVSMPPPKGQ